MFKKSIILLFALVVIGTLAWVAFNPPSAPAIAPEPMTIDEILETYT